jgi:hypothetical protein
VGRDDRRHNIFAFRYWVDFFLVDPVLALGVNDWKGLAELTFASAFALGLGVTASRMFPSLLDSPSQA